MIHQIISIKHKEGSNRGRDEKSIKHIQSGSKIILASQ